MTYKDRTFCASPNCTGECGRKLTAEDKAWLKDNPYMPVAMSYFCNSDKSSTMLPEDIKKALH